MHAAGRRRDPMASLGGHRTGQKLDDLADAGMRVPHPYPEAPHEVRDWLARLLVVRSRGYLEQTVLEELRGYVHRRSGGPGRAFGRSWLERGRNPSPEALTTRVRRFDAEWSSHLIELLEEHDQRIRREVAFRVDRRNKIAHGLNENVGAVKALQLLEVARDLADWFIGRFNPQRGDPDRAWFDECCTGRLRDDPRRLRVGDASPDRSERTSGPNGDIGRSGRFGGEDGSSVAAKALQSRMLLVVESVIRVAQGGRELEIRR